MMGSQSPQTRMVYGITLDELVAPDHFVRTLDTALDWNFVRKIARPYYSHLGQPSVDPVVLIKLTVLGYWERIRSERQLVRMLKDNNAWRWFLNLDLTEEVFDHSVLSKFRRRVGEKLFKELFREVVRQCAEQGLIRGETAYIDSTLTDADAAMHPRRSRALLEQLVPADEYVHELFVVNDGDEDEFRGPEPPREKRPRGRGLRPTAEPAPSRGIANKMASRTDIDAEFFRKEDEPQRLCHKTQLVVDGAAARIITAVHVTAATKHDSHDLPAVLKEHKHNVGRFPKTAVVDKGYNNGKAFSSLNRLGIEVITPPKNYGNSNGLYDQDAFFFDADRNLYICPEGHTLKEFSLHTKRRHTEYRPAPRTCRTCELRTQCTPGDGDRRLFRSWSQTLIDEAKERFFTERGQRLYAARGNISEGPNAELKVLGHMRRAKYRRRWRMAIQSYGEATTYNLKRLVRAGQYAAQGGIAVRDVAFAPLRTRLRVAPTYL